VILRAGDAGPLGKCAHDNRNGRPPAGLRALATLVTSLAAGLFWLLRLFR